MSEFELRLAASTAQVPTARQVTWPAPGSTGTLDFNLSPTLSAFGIVPDRAIDLVRLAAGVFAADQLVKRAQTFTRSVDLRVQVLDPAPFDDATLAAVADLLRSLSGDDWTLGILADPAARTAAPAPKSVPPAAERVALLSGGLDSYAGAVLSSQLPGRTAYLGYWHQSPERGAQNAIRRWFANSGHALEFHEVTLSVAGKAEQTTRTRSLFFMALGVALATAHGAETLLVPENGFTSINVPLAEDRGGALTTRSTHPRTIEAFNSLLAAIGIGVRVTNPHADQTKGELVAAAAAVAPAGFTRVASDTYSCAKPPQFFAGVSPVEPCGVCVACITRRAALIAAGVPDRTQYVSMKVGDWPGRAKFEAQRTEDAEAVRRAVLLGFEMEDLLAIGPFPDSFDFDAGLDLCRRGLAELGRVPL
jgi:7-cyano-7-deazaguanine synthase in queuosine biosynthesis